MNHAFFLRWAMALGLVLALLVPVSGCSSVTERAWLASGNRLYKAQKYEEALEEYQKIVNRNPESWDASYMIAVSYLALFHPGSTHEKDIEFAKKAVEAFQKLLKMKAPDDATGEKVRGFYVNLLVQSDRLDEAVLFFEEMLRQDPDNVEYLAQIAQLYGKKGDFPKTLEAYEKRAEVDPTNKEAWYTVGVVCWERSYRGGAMVSNSERARLVDRGLEALDKSLTIDPEYTAALLYKNLLWRERAKVLLDAGEVQEAGDAILKAAEFQKQALAIMNRNKAAAEGGAKTGA